MTNVWWCRWKYGGFRRNGGREPFQRPLRSTNLNQLRASSDAPFLDLSTATASPAISSDVTFLAFHNFYCLTLGPASPIFRHRRLPILRPRRSALLASPGCHPLIFQWCHFAWIVSGSVLLFSRDCLRDRWFRCLVFLHKSVNAQASAVSPCSSHYLAFYSSLLLRPTLLHPFPFSFLYLYFKLYLCSSIIHIRVVYSS